MRLAVLLLTVVCVAHPVSAQVALNVNQTHTLSWDWDQTAGPVNEFVFACGTAVRRIVEPDVRALAFGDLVDQPGRYTGCTLVAKNEAGSSAPVLVPDFEYAYSYTTLWLFVLELAAALGAVSGVVVVYGSKLLLYLLRGTPRPLTLPEPRMVLEKEGTRVHRHS